MAGFVDPWLLQRCQQCDPEDQSGLLRQSEYPGSFQWRYCFVFHGADFYHHRDPGSLYGKRAEMAASAGCVFSCVCPYRSSRRKAGKYVALFAYDDPFADFYCCKKPFDGMEVRGSSCGDGIGGVCACLVYCKTFVRYFHPPVVQGRNKDTEPFSPVIMADPA